MEDKYSPPYTITSPIVHLISKISELVGQYTVLANKYMTPYLRRENRIRTIQASLAIENNTLTLEQVTAVIEGKKVLGNPQEIHEVLNAFTAYEAMEGWQAYSEGDFLDAHKLLMSGLVSESGRYRSKGVGIFRGEELVHMAPPASIIPKLMGDLFHWVKNTDEHPLVASCIFHYELEFIHPFADGNGRMGRLWQTLILKHWKQFFAYLPVETVIRERQAEYYNVLGRADATADITPFIEFMLVALGDAIGEAIDTDQVSDYVSDQVKRFISVLGDRELSISSIMEGLEISHRPTFRKNYLTPALKAGFVELTQPNSPKSPTQRYRLTQKGRRLR